MPSPPLSPIPRRINTPLMADLLSSLERSSEDTRGFPGWRNTPSKRDEEGEVEDLLEPSGPEIRTHSPSPRRSDRLSPLSNRTFGSPGPASIQHRQNTGQSVSTIDQAFADIHDTLDQLAHGSPSPNPAPHTLPLPPSPMTSSPSSPRLGYRPLGLAIGTTDGSRLFPDDHTRLEVVSERTEPSSKGSIGNSPSPTFGRRLPLPPSPNRFPLPETPLKVPRSTPSLQSSPKKAADLIKMFENKSGDKAKISPTHTGSTPLLPVFERFDRPVTPPPAPPPSSYRPPVLMGYEPPKLNQPSPENVESLAPIRSRSASPTASPAAAFRSLVASWKNRSGSPTQRVVGSPGKELPKLKKEGGWNVSIRRRRRNEGREVGLAEMAEERIDEQQGQEDRDRDSSATPPNSAALSRHPTPPAFDRTPSLQSSRGSAPIITGEAIKAGTLWYLNVHDAVRAPDYVWVQADARLFPNGLQLAWRTNGGAQAMVTFDMEFCEEVASTYSPNHPLAEGDIGAMAARRQGQLAEDLYPFKLVYDDGTERLGCDSARDRVRWVNAIWTVLEQSRGPARQSLHVRRPTSIFSSSDDGSMSAWHNNNPRPHTTTDDAFITTSGGFHAPLAHRDSRRLAAGALGRTRSLRRVASEADLSDPVERDLGQDRYSDRPLTAEVARNRPVSRDFTFARGQAPPALSPPPMYTSPLLGGSPTTTYHAAQSQITSYHTPVSQSEIPSTFRTAQSEISTYRTPANQSQGTLYNTAQSQASTYRTPASQVTYQASAYTFGDGSTSMVTAQSEQTFIPPRAPYTAQPASVITTSERSSYFTPIIPSVAITVASPRQPASNGSAVDERESYRTPLSGLSDYRTAPSAAELGSPFVLSGDKVPDANASSKASAKGSNGSGSESSYQTAPPPVPSRDEKYNKAASKTDSSIRYQLHDPPVPSQSYSSSTSYPPAPPASIVELYETVQSRPSEYNTAVSRALSFSSEMQEQAETATHISDGTDYDLIADLERQSSAGSALIQRRPVGVRTRSYDSAQSVETTRGGVTTVYQTAGESAYATAQSWHTTSYHTAPEPASSKPSSISTAQSTASASAKGRRVPVPSLPPPSPSVPSSHHTFVPPSDPGTVPSYSDGSTVPTRAGIGYDLGRMMNYLQGQDEARQGQTTRLSTQLDRIEGKVSNIAENMAPPPLPSEGPRSRSSSSSSIETARPVTPPAYIVPAIINDRLDDMQLLLGQLVGQNRDLMDEVARGRSYEVELPPMTGAQKRLEDMMRQILKKLGGGEEYDEYRPEYGSSPPPSPPATAYTKDGSMYGGSGSVFSEDKGMGKAHAPAPSFTSSYDRKKRFSGVPDSLLNGSIGRGEFDHFNMDDLPPDDPPREHIIPHVQVPPHLARHRKQQSESHTPDIPPAIPEEPEYYEESIPELVEDKRPNQQAYAETQSESPSPPPVPYKDDTPSDYSSDYNRGPAYRGPPPQAVDLPTPVNSHRNLPTNGPGYMPGMPMGRPPYPGMMPPGAINMPRPSLPRIAGVRDPISTTYFRRGFPPQGPMGMGMGPMGMGGMGMFPGPMGIPGPGMGPFMPGLRPGLGGPIGPNVNPNFRRPGFFPPGVPGTAGGYGLPAASRYGLGGPSRPGQPGQLNTPDTGLGNTTSESSSSPSATTEQLVTPIIAHQPLETITVVNPPSNPALSADTDDSFRRALDNTQTLTEAQGIHQNEMSRFMHGLSDQMTRNRSAADMELGQILNELGRLRNELKPKHITGRVLPDGTVVLDNGDVVDGVRGAPLPGSEHLPPPPPSVPHVTGRVLPDGTVMAGDAILDGVRGAPQPEMTTTETMLPPQQMKDLEQDRNLAALMDKVAELMRRTENGNNLPVNDIDHASINAQATPHFGQDILREKTTIKEHEVIREGHSHDGHSHHGGNDHYDDGHRHPTFDIGTQCPAAAAPGGIIITETTPGGGTTVTKINPRTGKPLTLPQPLSLQPRDPSPIETTYGDAADVGQLVREEHEEVIQRPGGGPPITTKTTTQTYLNPNGTTTTSNNVPPTAAGLSDPGLTGMSNIPSFPPPQTAGRFSDHEAIVQAPAPIIHSQKQTTEEHTVGPNGAVVDKITTSVEETKLPPAATVANVPPAGSNAGGKVPSAPSAAGGMANVPPVGAGGASLPPSSTGMANIPPVKQPKPIWDTNHAKPITTSNNVPPAAGGPSAPAPGSTGAPAGPPAGASMANVPPTTGAGGLPAGGMANVPPTTGAGATPISGMANVPPPKQPKPITDTNHPKPISTSNNVPPVGDAGAPGQPGSLSNVPPGATPPAGKQGLGVSWIPHLPVREANGPPPKTKPTPPPSTQPAGLPSTNLQNVPSAADPAGQSGVSIPLPTNSSTTVEEKTKPTSSGGSVLSKLRPSSSKENVKSSTEGPPIVSDLPLNVTNGKQTRFSDTAHVSPSPPAQDGSTVHNIGSTPTASPVNKLHKPKPGSTTMADTPDAPGSVTPGGTILVPGPSATPGKSTPGSTNILAPGSGATKPVPGASSGIITPLPAPHQLEEFIMPDGSVAYIKKTDRPTAGKVDDSSKLKKNDKTSTSTALPPIGGMMNESAMGHGHCSVCCPSAPKTQAGQPVQPCAHQDGPSVVIPGAPAATAPAKVGASKITKPVPGPNNVLPPSMPEVNVTDVNNIGSAPAADGKKLSKPMPGAGPSQSGEQKMEEARLLAVKQKAAAEQAAAEKAERDAMQKAKADKARVQDERHKANLDALGNLQKLLESIAHDQKDKSVVTDKRRTDKTARDKKFQDTLDKLIIQKDEGKKKEDDKTKKDKEGTQAVLDAIQKFGTQEKEFLDRLAKGILEQNSKQHEETRNASKLHAREQVGFNLAGYLDDFSKSLSGEVRSLLHEVSGLRETRRALYYELAELLLMKGRQSAGDLMAIMPYPAKPPPGAAKPAAEKAKGGGGGGKPGGIPAWSAWQPPPGPNTQFAMPPMPAAGGPRPLPQPGMMPMGDMFNMAPMAVPGPPPATGNRPLPPL